MRILVRREHCPAIWTAGEQKMTSQTFIDLSRWQFATTAAFHMTFPALSVGLAIFLVVCYGAYYWTGNPLYLQMFRFWRKIFALGFALGIVAGIVLTFELGLNWGNYARAVGPILGPIICLEALTAFFLEAGFIGILLYGEGRVSKRVTMVATSLVALGRCCRRPGSWRRTRGCRRRPATARWAASSSRSTGLT
jgi:cytochrome bd ubiquinol oxidase subunit I